MTLNELIERLTELKEENYGELLVAISDEDLKEVTSCEVEISSDGVGQFIELG